MTRTRARRLIRTTAALWAAIAFAFTIDFYASSHPIAGTITLAVFLTAATTTWLASTAQPHATQHHPRQRPQSPPRRHPGLGEYPIEVAMFRAQISAWEAEQRTGQ